MENFIWAVHVVGLAGHRNFDVFVGNRGSEGWSVQVFDLDDTTANHDDLGAKEVYGSFDDAVSHGFAVVGRVLATEIKEL